MNNFNPQLHSHVLVCYCHKSADWSPCKMYVFTIFYGKIRYTVYSSCFSEGVIFWHFDFKISEFNFAYSFLCNFLKDDIKKCYKFIFVIGFLDFEMILQIEQKM